MKQHSTKVFRDIVNALGSFIQSLFLVPNAGNVLAATNQTGKRMLVFFQFLNNFFGVTSVSVNRKCEYILTYKFSEKLSSH